MKADAPDPASITLTFDEFWSWLKAHRNCIVRAGTPYSVLMDHDDYHWDVLQEDEDTQILQLVRGKDLVGEIIVMVADIAYVHCPPCEGEEQIFECVVETEQSREIVYHFAMAHPYEGEPTQSRSWTH